MYMYYYYWFHLLLYMNGKDANEIKLQKNAMQG